MPRKEDGPWVRPKSRDGNVEAIRALMVAKRSARSVRIKTLNQIRHLSFTAPEEIRARYKDITSCQGIATEVAALRPRVGGDPVVHATKIAMRTLGRRVLALDEEMAAVDELLTELVTATAPELLELHGVGIDTAATLLVAAGDNVSGCVTKPRGHTSAVSRRSKRPQARPCDTDSTGAATAKPTMRSGAGSAARSGDRLG